MTFIKNHIPWNKGIPMSAVTKLKVSNSKKGVKLSHYIRTKPWVANAGVFKKGLVPWTKGKHLSDETKRKIRETNLRKGIKPPQLAIDRAKNTITSRKRSLEHSRKLSISLKGHKPSLLARQRTVEVKTGTKASKETKQRMSNTWIGKYADKEFKENRIRAIARGLTKRPTKPEKRIIDVLSKYFPNQYKYNGDYSQEVILNSMIPDFVNVNGRKLVIEIFGNYHHDPKMSKKITYNRTYDGRLEEYKKVGFNCLILWELDIKYKTDLELVEVINKFHEYADTIKS